jgi:AcrR family transcriptional regulator
MSHTQEGKAHESGRPGLREALRARILDAARRIVTRDGFEALSMRKIAHAIGYSPASLYLYFESRDEIARALGDEGHAQLLAELEPRGQIADPAERLRALAHAYVAFGQSQPQAYRLVFVDLPGRARPDGERVLRAFAGALAALGHPDDTPLAEALWATLHGVVTLMLTRPGFPQAPLESLLEAALGPALGTTTATPRERTTKRTTKQKPRRATKQTKALAT